jgi:hypothetical protein
MNISRRGFLGCTALPVLAGLVDPRRRAFAAPAAPPRRLLIWAHQEGAIRNVLLPAGGDGAFTLGASASPLEPWRSRMSILDGVHNTAGEKHLMGDTHEKARSGLLTGATVTARIAPPLVAPSESLDQFLGPKLQGPARLPSAELTVQVDGGPGTGIIYPLGGGTQLPMLGQASQVFDRLFGGLAGAMTPDDPAARRLRTLRASVLDHVSADLTRLRGRLPARDGHKLDAHLSAIRDLERQVTAPAAVGCSVGARPVDVSARDKTQIPAATKVMMDMIVQAFACDVTRLITFSPTDSGMSGAPQLGEARDVHLISHGKYGDWNDIGPRYIKWVYQQHAYLLDRLSQVQEGDGTLLDHTLVLSLHDFGDSASHGFRNLHIAFIGDAGGYLRTGRFITYKDKPHNNVLVTVANAMGVPIKTFGEPGLCDGGPLPELRA